MGIKMIGIDHSCAPVAIREQFAFRKTTGAEAMKEINSLPKVLGSVILSTCNRMEVWIHEEDGADTPLYETICRIKGIQPDSYRNLFRFREGEDAVRHLFYLTSGLKSAILCEDQILTQVKNALRDAREAYCTDAVLETLFRMAVTGAKKVKSGMQMSTGNSSAIEEAVAAMKQKGYSFSGKNCMVIGNGEMGKRSAMALMKEGASVTVTVRQYHSGIVDIPRGCRRINYGDRYELLPACDVLVSATSSPNHTITKAEAEKVVTGKKQLYIDLAVPRDIEKAVGELPGITLYDIDSFHIQMSDEMRQQIRHAEEILEEQMEEFHTWYECRDLVPYVKQISDGEAEELYWRMGKTVKEASLSEQQTKQLRRAVTDAASKEISSLLFTIRDRAGVSVFRECLRALKD